MKVWQYETTTVWKSGKEGRLHAAGNPEIGIATPPEFGGPQNIWSPEDLLTGAVGACLMTSMLYFLDQAGVDLRSYMSNAKGTMEKTSDGLAFTRIEVQISVAVGTENDVGNARQAGDMAEKSCPVSKALKCPVNVNIHVNVHRTGEL